jgi:Asp-tRNA(Asn)/Glu-tRNA(Gln) amidotransferase A subunit family amidase
MDELVSHSATALVELIRNRAISPVEVASAYLSRIEELNPRLNAIVTLAPDFLDQAKAAEAAVLSGEALGPLHGLPITIKDTIETAGLRTTSGSPIRAGFIPEFDAPAVARLRAAGAIILGKTNTAEMAMDYNTDNPVFGRATNPHDPLVTTGGSSGGEAVAIAACMSPAGIGSDLAGSVRIPAHCCGIAALKPTVGRVPGGGQFPPSAGPYALGSTIGPMSRSVADLRLLFNVLADSQPEVSAESLSSHRVAWYTDDLTSPVTAETRDAVETAARVLADAGLNVKEMRPPGIERGHELWLKLFSRASVVLLREVYAGRETEAGSFVRWRLATAEDISPQSLDDYVRLWLERDRLRSELVQWMESTPLLLAPVGAVPAFPNDALKVTVGEQSISTFRGFSYSQTFNAFDLPVAVIPVGRSAEGLPIGVQIIGRPFAEDTVLTAASIIEAALSLS